MVLEVPFWIVLPVMLTRWAHFASHPAAGGQIDIEECAHLVNITGSTIQNGTSSTTYGDYWAYGIETHGYDLTINDNIITNNGGEGISVEGGTNIQIYNGDQSKYISRNNRRASGDFFHSPFPGIRIYGLPGRRTPDQIAITNATVVNDHSYGVALAAYSSNSVQINNVTIQNNCLARNTQTLNLAQAGTSGVVTSPNTTTGCGPP